MESRKHAIDLVELGISVSEASQLAGVSRQCLHKWLARYREQGWKGLRDHSRAPKRHAFAVTKRMRQRVVAMKKRFPSEGPRKLRGYLETKYPGERIPAASTMSIILKEAGLVAPRRRRRTNLASTKTTLTTPTAPNDVWCIDYKGEFLVDGRHCYPLTATDLFSKFDLVTRAHSGAVTTPTMRCMWNAFGTYGMPAVIRSDNGMPFISPKSPAGMSRFSVMLTRLGIRHERIAMGRPDQNGSHERFHRSLKAATANPPAGSWSAQQRRFDRYRKHYNHVRCHEALEMRPPANVFCNSSRTRPSKLPPIQHPRAQRILKIYSNGEMSLRGFTLFLSHSLRGETVAANEVEEDLVSISYGAIHLGVFSFRTKKPTFTQAP